MCSTLWVCESVVGQSDIEMKDIYFLHTYDGLSWDHANMHVHPLKTDGDALFWYDDPKALCPSVNIVLMCTKQACRPKSLTVHIRFCLCVIRSSLTVVTVFALILNWTWSPFLLHVLHTKINNAVIQQPVYLVNNLCF